MEAAAPLRGRMKTSFIMRENRRWGFGAPGAFLLTQPRLGYTSGMPAGQVEG
jgi:hypothetical protein